MRARAVPALLLPGLALVLLLVACRSQPQILRFSGFAQGTMYHVAVVAPAGFDTGPLQRAVDAELARVDRLFSNYRDDSVIAQFNAAPARVPFEVGPELVALVEKARGVHAASLGCFDPTVGPLTRLWRRVAESGELPGPAALERAHQSSGLDTLIITNASHLEKQRRELELDLSAIAQGQSLALLAGVVEAAGIDAYSIEIGGELMVRGRRPDARPWRIAVLDPAADDTVLPEIIEYAGDRPQTISTSGTYHHFTEIDGRRYSHILDPRSGRPITHDTVSVTVIHRDPALADAWSTALLCLGEEQGMAVAAGHDLAALFIRRDGSVETTPAWPGRE